jgi:membrane dipeptidase
MPMRRLALFALAAATLAACASPRPAPSRGGAQGDLMARARALAQRAIIVDGHIDLPYRFTEEPWAIAARTDTLGDFDFARARAGGLDAPFMSIYIPAAKQEVPGAAKAFADSLIDLVERYTAAFPT